MVFDYYYGDQTEQFQFVMIPRALISGKEFEDLSFAAKLIYGLLRDKISLSRKNGWFDSKGRVYIIYTNKQLMEEMSLSEKLVIKYTNELEAFGLIEKKRQGLGLPNLIYVKNVISTSEKKEENDDETQCLCRPSQMGSSGTSEMGSSDLPEWEAQDFPTQGVQELPKRVDNLYLKNNNTDFYNTDNNETHILSSGRGQNEKRSEDRIDESIKSAFYEKHVKIQIDYDSLLEDGYDEGTVDNVVSMMAEVMSQEEGVMMIGKQQRSIDQVKTVFFGIKKKHVEYVLDMLYRTGSEIRNIRHYMLTMLYNAPQTYDCYIVSEVARRSAG